MFTHIPDIGVVFKPFTYLLCCVSVLLFSYNIANISIIYINILYKFSKLVIIALSNRRLIRDHPQINYGSGRYDAFLIALRTKMVWFFFG